LAIIAAVESLWVEMAFSLADDWETSTAAAWANYGTTRSGVTGGQSDAGSLILITVPVINPALTVRTRATVGKCGGFQKVVNVNVCQVHS